MLIRFRVKNFRSICDEQELSFVAANLGDSKEKVVSSDSSQLDLLRVIGVYGANASGKSTILNALKFMQSAITRSHRKWEPNGGVPQEPFIFKINDNPNLSFFEADILLENVRYTYGFTIDSEQIVEEWLFAYPEGRRQTWFTRENQTFNFTRFLTGENKSIQLLTRNNSLFLSAAAQNNHKKLNPIYDWFADKINIIDSDFKKDNPLFTAEVYENPNYKNTILKIMQNSDLGITGIDVGKEELPTRAKVMLEAFFESNNDLLENLKRNPTIHTVSFRHFSKFAGEDISIPISDESKGTQILFGIAGLIAQKLKNGGFLAIDEMDSSLHPMMAIELVKMFNDPSRNINNTQLLFNTHDVSILDCGELRRDQIWFTEKDLDGATHLYPLTDFKPRQDENIKKGYLQGRYGAVPFIKGFNFVDELDGKK